MTAPWRLEDAEAHLLSLELFGMRFGLERMRRLLTALDAPQERFAAIHARLEVPFVAAVRRHADQHGVEPALDPLQTHLAMACMSMGLTLERLVRPDVVEADTGARISRLVLDQLVKGAGDVGADRTTDGRRKSAAARARASRA